MESGTVTRSVVSPSAPPVNISLSVGKIQTTTESVLLILIMLSYTKLLTYHLHNYTEVQSL